MSKAYTERCQATEAAFSANLAKAMERRHVDAAELAKRLDVSEQTIERWLKGHAPRFGAIEPIRRALDVMHHELLRGN